MRHHWLRSILIFTTLCWRNPSSVTTGTYLPWIALPYGNLPWAVGNVFLQTAVIVIINTQFSLVNFKEENAIETDFVAGA